MIDIRLYLLLGAILFCAGIFIVLSKRHIIVVLIGIELIFNAANLNLVVFSQYDVFLKGQVFSLFVLVIAAIETTLALAILVQIYRYFKTSHLDHINTMKND